MAALLGVPLGAVLAMPAAEFDQWQGFRVRHGFPADRVVIGLAKGFAAVCQTWGGKVTAVEMLPRFGPVDPQQILASAEAFFGPPDPQPQPEPNAR